MIYEPLADATKLFWNHDAALYVPEFEITTVREMAPTKREDL